MKLRAGARFDMRLGIKLQGKNFLRSCPTRFPRKTVPVTFVSVNSSDFLNLNTPDCPGLIG